jgi:hypothetical protein
MLRKSCVCLAAGPRLQIAPETTPIKFTRELLEMQDAPWWNGVRPKMLPEFQERPMERAWPYKQDGWIKGRAPVLHTRYSAAALQEALAMVPGWFETADVPRPPARIKAHSEGIVGRWYTNYWTLHSVKYQCMLARVPWRWGERERPMTNYEQPFVYVDYEESKAIRDYRSRWINVHRSLVGMSKKMKDAEDEARFVEYKRMQDQFWSDRRVLVNRIKSMKASNTITQADLPLSTMNLRALD